MKLLPHGQACRGVGVEWGLALDAGHLAQHLAACGEPFLGSLLKVLEAIDGDDQPCLTDAAATRIIHAPVVRLFLIEWIAATGEAARADPARGICWPRLWCSRPKPRRFLLSKPQRAALGRGWRQVKGSNVLKPDDMVPISTSEAAPGAGENRLAPLAGVAVDVPSSCWQRLMEYACLCAGIRPSRAAGAGAGDIDNE